MGRESCFNHVDEEFAALLVATEAWVHAHLMHPEQCAAAIDRAERLVSEVAKAQLFAQAELAGIAGACYEVLAARADGDARHRYAMTAQARIGEALRLRDPGYVRTRVLDLAGLAMVYLVSSEPEQAAVVAADAVHLAVRLRSSRTRRRLHKVVIRALDSYPDVRAVRDLATTVRTALPVT